MFSAGIHSAPIAVSLDGGIVSEAANYARMKVSRALVRAPRRAAAVIVRLRSADGPPRAVTATADVELAGRLLHARATAGSEWRAIDALADRLHHQVAAFADQRTRH